MSLLEIESLSVTLNKLSIVSDLSLRLERGQTLALVGESGSGKSVSSLAILGLINAEVTAKTLRFNGLDLLTLKPKARRALLGKDMALIAQDPMNALNPSLSIGYQLQEVLATHLKLKGQAATHKALELLDKVKIPNAKSRLSAYAHELSGGMNQRIAIAMALACSPKLLIADEPTTALDVTVQQQVLSLLTELQRDEKMAMLLVTHDLALASQYADDVCVMYAGQWVEQGLATELLTHPKHPYTEALLNALPGAPDTPLKSLPGQVPNLGQRASGCLLAERCAYRQACCQQEPPVINNVRCFFPRSVP